MLPVPASLREGFRCVLTVRSVHWLCFDDAQMWSRLNDVAQAVHRSFFDGGLVDEHYGNVVADGINAFTLDAFQCVPIRL